MLLKRISSSSPQAIHLRIDGKRKTNAESVMFTLSEVESLEKKFHLLSGPMQTI